MNKTQNHHIEIEKVALGSIYVEDLRNERHESLASNFADLKSELLAFIANVSRGWHEIQLGLNLIEIEVKYIIDCISSDIHHHARRLLSLISALKEYVTRKIESPEQDKNINEEVIIEPCGQVKKTDIIMLGHALYDFGYKNSNKTKVEFIRDLCKAFGFEASDAYISNAATDFRDHHRSGGILFLQKLYEHYLIKLQQAIEKSDARYDRSVAAERKARRR